MPDSDELNDILKQFSSNEKDENTKEEAPLSDAEPSFQQKVQVVKDEPIDADGLEDMSPKKKNGKPWIIIAVVVILIIAIIVGIVLAKGNSKDKTTTQATTQATTTEVATTKELSKNNPLTGSSDFNESAVGKRSVAFVVENSQSARPQWGIDDEKSPDIIVEGEVEGGETRMLWLYADYTNLPSQIGPMRSARPPYIRFSEMFDSIFIHWGQSQTKIGTDYIGANTYFRKDNVDHINQMTYSGSVALFGRDSSRNVSTEHTGVCYGDKVAAAIKEEGFRTKANQKSYTKFKFFDEESTVSDKACNTLSLTFSNRTNTRDWTYNSDDKMYHCSDYETDVTRKNLLVLFDTTEYVTKANYKNSGSAEVYCNYGLSGGKGKLATNGTVIDVTWAKKNGKLKVYKANGKKVKLNVGKTWIGYASSNNGGSVSIS